MSARNAAQKEEALPRDAPSAAVADGCAVIRARSLQLGAEGAEVEIFVAHDAADARLPAPVLVVPRHAAELGRAAREAAALAPQVRHQLSSRQPLNVLQLTGIVLHLQSKQSHVRVLPQLDMKNQCASAATRLEVQHGGVAPVPAEDGASAQQAAIEGERTHLMAATSYARAACSSVQ